MAIVERPRIYEGTHIPTPIPTILGVPEELRESENILQVNFGPNHPSTHGVLRLVVDLAIEKLLGMQIPEKARWMRTLLSELNRIHSHLVWLGTAALELGAISVFWYAFRERDQILDLFEMVTGVRM